MENSASYLGCFSISFEKNYVLYRDFDLKSWSVDFLSRFIYEKSSQNNFSYKKTSVENNLLLLIMYHCTFKCLTKLYNKLSYLMWFLNSLLFIIAKGHVKYLLINGRRVSKVGKEFADFEGWEPSINDINHLGGGEICQKVTLLHKPI